MLVFGSFDVIHKGHIHFLEEAKSLGNRLVIVIARDTTIAEVKGKKPHHSEQERKKHLQKLACVYSVIIGNSSDKYKVIEKIKPDIICLGYDQVIFTDRLEQELNKRGIANIDIVRLNEFKPHIYKSSKIKAKRGSD